MQKDLTDATFAEADAEETTAGLNRIDIDKESNGWRAIWAKRV